MADGSIPQLVGVCGSGIMGAGLAEVVARAGTDVIVRSRSQSAIDAMLATITGNLSKAVAKEKMTQDEMNTVLSHVRGTTDIADLGECDLVIESIVEDLDTKLQLFAELDGAVKPSGILATNTSTLPVISMAQATSRPDRVCGIHFFNPAVMMSLVEVVRAATSSEETISSATAFVRHCGKDAVQVLDRAGFIVNALLFPYLNNAIRMWESGTASMEDIDVAMRGGCNFPMGPFSLLDLVGLDTSLAILTALHESFADPNYAPAETLKQLVAEGKLGRKTKHGFFAY
jgi:3-hydroxybutyryl-CoA dehydrogenase